jgi:alanyl-tRNA synthetase
MSLIQPYQIRETFLEYFEKHGHRIVPSASLLPDNDPTLLFINAGMNPFKNVFLGLESRDYNRATSFQKCIRAGGKHNDLDNVGFTARHHTFFEMLGNFSFGDYFKKEAIHFSWSLLTEVFGIPKEKLYVTVFESDTEALKIWTEQEGLPKDRVFPMGEKDNFWRMGDTGPCGPSTEIFYDHGSHIRSLSDPFQSILAGEDRFVEIWNIVFMQFDEHSPGQMAPLPAPSVDTGSGLERLTAVLQQTPNNYNTSLFKPLISSLCEKTGFDLDHLLKQETTFLSQNRSVTSSRDKKVLTPPKEMEVLSALRVLSDHIRSSCFLIGEQMRPSNEGRGYVLRRIIRRALRYSHKIAPGISLFPNLSSVLIEEMNSCYPDLKEQKNVILSTLQEEEFRFLATLDQGQSLIEQELKRLPLSGTRVLSGKVAFKLYDTFGFPLDLTELIARENQVLVDLKEFEILAEEAKARSRSSWKGQSLSLDEKSFSKWIQEMKSLHGPTQFQEEPLTESLYEKNCKENQKKTERSSPLLGQFLLDENTLVLLFQKTPFYALGGGQAPDSGFIVEASTQTSYPLVDVQKKNDMLLHFIRATEEFKLLKPTTSLGLSTSLESSNPNITLPSFHLVVDQGNRFLTTCNHSATHLLHWALREILGPSVTQAGSDVTQERLRFDFTFSRALTVLEIQQVENLINEEIQKSIPTRMELLPFQEAQKKGALAFFQDKYGDLVRVLSIGSKSVELCGGTHVTNTAEIGLCILVSESSVSSGVRRIEALTSKTALHYLNNIRQQHLHTLNLLGQNPGWEHWSQPKVTNLSSDAVEKLKLKIKNLEKELSKTKQSQISVQDLIQEAPFLQNSSIQFIFGNTTTFSDFTRDQLMAKSDEIKASVLSQKKSVIYLLHSHHATILGIAPSHPQLSAGALFKKLSSHFGGKGGGRPELAQGFLPIPVEESNKKILELITEYVTEGITKQGSN